MGVELRCESAKGRRFCPTLRRDARGLLRAAGIEACELSLSLVSDDTVRRLNRDFRGIDQPTDVLSFPQLEERGWAIPWLPQSVGRTETLLGDVVISIDTALQQARELKTTPAGRLRTLLIHGFLHLLGYDHERSRRDALRMAARERELVNALGAAPRARRAREPRPASKVPR